MPRVPPPIAHRRSDYHLRVFLSSPRQQYFADASGVLSLSSDRLDRLRPFFERVIHSHCSTTPLLLVELLPQVLKRSPRLMAAVTAVVRRY